MLSGVRVITERLILTTVSPLSNGQRGAAGMSKNRKDQDSNRIRVETNRLGLAYKEHSSAATDSAQSPPDESNKRGMSKTDLRSLLIPALASILVSSIAGFCVIYAAIILLRNHVTSEPQIEPDSHDDYSTLDPGYRPLLPMSDRRLKGDPRCAYMVVLFPQARRGQLRSALRLGEPVELLSNSATIQRLPLAIC